jgi:beta-alanine degradation protein BauB
MTNQHRSSEHETGSASTSLDSSGANGITRRDVLALLAAFGVPDTAFAASDTTLSNDPVLVAPKSYRVVFENDRVRVLEYNNRPGLGPCGRGRHYHPAHLDVFLSEFTGRMTHEDGRISTGRPKVGQVGWFEAETHEVENVDKSVVRMLMVELKDANWKPSTG